MSVSHHRNKNNSPGSCKIYLVLFLKEGEVGTLIIILIFCQSGVSWLLLVRISQMCFLHSTAERHVLDSGYVLMDILLACSVWKD